MRAGIRNIGENSPRWAFLKWLTIQGPDGGLYLKRLRIIQTPWFGLFWHRIYTADGDQDLHDHPYDFIAFIARGWYSEELMAGPDDPCRDPRGRTLRQRHWFNFKRATELHRIRHVSRAPVWSFLLVGPRKRVWGFQTPAGWVDEVTYRSARDGR